MKVRRTAFTRWMMNLEETVSQSEANFRKTVQKYIVLQIPGAFMVAVLLVVFH